MDVDVDAILYGQVDRRVIKPGPPVQPIYSEHRCIICSETATSYQEQTSFHQPSCANSCSQAPIRRPIGAITAEQLRKILDGFTVDLKRR